MGVVTSYCPDGVAATEAVLGSRVPVRCFYDLDTPVTLARLAATGAAVRRTDRDGTITVVTDGRTMEVRHAGGADRWPLPCPGPARPMLPSPAETSC